MEGAKFLDTIGIQSDRLLGLYMIGTLAVCLILRKCFSIYTGPLAHLPGPTVSKWTNLRLKYAILTGWRAEYVHALHMQYGSVVRISPWEVSTTDLHAVREMYKIASRFEKSSYYRDLTGNPRLRLFTMPDSKAHAERRRILSNDMSESNLKLMERDVQAKVNLAMNGMKKEAEKYGSVDIFKWWTFRTTDVVGELSFGESFRMLEKGKKDQYIIDLERRGRVNIYRMELQWLVDWLSWLPQVREIKGSSTRFWKYARDLMAKYRDQLESGQMYCKPTLFTKMLRSQDAGILDEVDTTIEAIGYIVAGSDTAAVALTYLIWQLARHPDIQKELRQEVAQSPAKLDNSHLKGLKLLNNVIQETLRLHSPVPSGLPRIVPAEGIEIQGHYVPKGVQISAQAYSLHRVEDIFPNGGEFLPSRWETPTQAMKDTWIPYGAGGRICLGKNLASMELRLGVANFLRLFPEGFEVATGVIQDPMVAAEDTDKRRGMNLEDMEQRNYFLSAPKGHRCLIRTV